MAERLELPEAAAEEEEADGVDLNVGQEGAQVDVRFHVVLYDVEQRVLHALRHARGRRRVDLVLVPLTRLSHKIRHVNHALQATQVEVGRAHAQFVCGLLDIRLEDCEVKEGVEAAKGRLGELLDPETVLGVLDVTRLLEVLNPELIGDAGRLAFDHLLIQHQCINYQVLNVSLIDALVHHH